MSLRLGGRQAFLFPSTPFLLRTHHPGRGLLSGEKKQNVTALCIVIKVININEEREKSWAGGCFTFLEGPTVFQTTDAALLALLRRKLKQSIDWDWDKLRS